MYSLPFGDERVGIDRLGLVHRDDQVGIACPRAFGVEPRRLGRVVRMAVVVADDLHSLVISLTLNPDVVPRIDLIAIARAVDNDVARTLDLGHRAIAGQADHDAADLMRVAFGAVSANRVHRPPGDLHLPARRGGRRPKAAGWGRAFIVSGRRGRSTDTGRPSPETPSPRRPCESSAPACAPPRERRHSNVRPAIPRSAPPLGPGHRPPRSAPPRPRQPQPDPRCEARSRSAGASVLPARGTSPPVPPRWS